MPTPKVEKAGGCGIVRFEPTAAACGQEARRMKTIRLHLDENDSLPSMLTTALLVARRFGSHIEGFHVRAGVPRMVPAGPEGSAIATTELIESLEREERVISRRVRERFEEFMRE